MAEVTFAANQGDFGGGEVMLLAMAEIARELGHRVQVVAPAKPGTTAQLAREAGFSTVEISSDSTVDYLRSLRTWDRHERSGLLWCNGLRPAFATSGTNNRVVHLHTLPTGAQTVAARLATTKALRVVVPSEFMRANIAIRSTCLLNWTTELVPDHRELPMSPPVRIGFLGRITRGKGADVLVHAVAKLQDEHPGRFELIMAGEARFNTRADADAVQLALGRLHVPAVQPGWISREDFFSRADLAVFPSVEPESFGLTAAEAMAAGCPFVISDAGALAEVAGERAHVARRGDADALATALLRATESYTQTELDQARQRWEQLYSPAAGQERFSALLSEIVEEMQ